MVTKEILDRREPFPHPRPTVKKFCGLAECGEIDLHFLATKLLQLPHRSSIEIGRFVVTKELELIMPRNSKAEDGVHPWRCALANASFARKRIARMEPLCCHPD